MTDGLPLDDAALSVAADEDAAELLVRQRCCSVEEALTNDTLDIPALHESLERAGYTRTAGAAPPHTVGLAKPRPTATA